MKLEDLPTTPGLPELIESECKEVGGVDLLGLRVVGENMAVRELDGITTITGTVRYLGLYAWLIQEYGRRGGVDHYTAFDRFARKVEAAFVMGNQLVDRSTPGLVGAGKGGDQIDQGSEAVTLRPLVNIPAIAIFANASRDLGITWDRPQIAGLTVERGVPLAEAVDELVGDVPILQEIDLDSTEQEVEREQLRPLGEKLPLYLPTGTDRKLLIDAIMPRDPRESELPRLRTYCMLLQMIENAGQLLSADDVYTRIVRASLESVPSCLHTTYNDWVPFVTRDMLVAVHEAAVSVVTVHLETVDHPDRRQPINTILEHVTAELDEMLSLLKLDDLHSSDPISHLAESVITNLGASEPAGSVRRWPGILIEPHVATLAVGSQDFNPIVMLLPIAWLLAYERHRPADTSVDDLSLGEGMHGQTRIGIHSVIRPEVARWFKSERSIRQVVADMVRRSVDQHLRIAWSRLSREPWKDVSVIASDGDEWIYIKRLHAGRSASRLDQVLRWLTQLGLVAADGITDQGRTLLADRLHVLEQSQTGYA